MFTDTEIGMKLQYDRTIRQHTAVAQDIIDQKNLDLDTALAEIRRLRAALASETAARQAAELKVEGLKKLARSLA